MSWPVSENTIFRDSLNNTVQVKHNFSKGLLNVYFLFTLWNRFAPSTLGPWE